MINLSGVVMPDSPGGVDYLRVLWADRCLKAAVAMLARDDAPNSQMVLAVLRGIGFDTARTLFESSLASFDTAVETGDDVFDDRDELARTKALVRHVIGAPDIADLTLILTPADLPHDLFLPHLGIVLRSTAGPVVSIRQTNGRVQVLRDDGLMATFVAGVVPPNVPDHPLFRSVPHIGRIPVLNSDGGVARALGHLNLARPNTMDEPIARLRAGLQFLEQIWPMAHDALNRHVRGIVALAPRGFERSHSPRPLCGTIAMTAGMPITVGDLLCHEASHIRMHWLKARDTLVEARHAKAARAGFDSPWRNDKRPIDGLTLGVHAFLNVCSWYARVADQSHGDLAAFANHIYDRQAENVRIALETLRVSGKPTRIGTEILDRFQAEVMAMRPAQSKEPDHA